MEITKVNIVYFSPTKSTQKILRSIASAFDVEIIEYDYTFKVGKEPAPSFDSNELVIVGSPVYAGRVPSVAQSFYKNIKGKSTPVIPIVVYGNRDFDDALLELCDYLQESDFKVICAGAFVGEHSYGPEIAGGRPDKDDLTVAKSFGEQARSKLGSLTDLGNLPGITVSGNRPYKALVAGEPWCPEATEECNQCGICAASCPMGIITQNEPSIVSDPSLCIHCCSCIKNCPINARQCSAEPYLKFRSFLIEKFSSIRKEPTTFI